MRTHFMPLVLIRHLLFWCGEAGGNSKGGEAPETICFLPASPPLDLIYNFIKNSPVAMSQF